MSVAGAESRFDTPHGEARTVTVRARHPRATLLLNHGAGGGIGGADLQALARTLPREGVSVVLLEQPWVLAGRKVATAPPTLDVALRVAAGRLRSRVPLVVGGRSAGARCAARCAREIGAVACLALAFPLHPPGRPEKSRLGELLGSGVPTLVVQGERDAFGRPEEFPAEVELSVVPGADHGYAVPRRGPLGPEQALDLVVAETLAWLERTLPGGRVRECANG